MPTNPFFMLCYAYKSTLASPLKTISVWLCLGSMEKCPDYYWGIPFVLLSPFFNYIIYSCILTCPHTCTLRPHMYLHTCTHMHTTPTHIHTHTHTHTLCPHKYLHICTHMHTTSTHVLTHMHTHAHYAHTSTYIHTYTHTCTLRPHRYLHTYTHTCTLHPHMYLHTCTLHTTPTHILNTHAHAHTYTHTSWHMSTCTKHTVHVYNYVIVHAWVCMCVLVSCSQTNLLASRLSMFLL